MKVFIRSVSVLWAFWLTFAPAFAQASDLPDLGEVIAAESILEAKLRTDTIVFPETDAEAVTASIKALVAQAQSGLPSDASEWDRIQAAQRVLYQPGSWNDDQPFAYDHTDPTGTKIENKSLQTYLRTRRGNCVSMPILFAIVLEGLGVPVTLGQAPEHVFVIWAMEGGDQLVNLEATSGGNPARNEWYLQNSIITPEALQNGVYLRALPIPERNAVIAATYLEYLRTADRHEDVLRVADLLLEAHPDYAALLVFKSNALFDIMQRDFASKWPDANDVPLDQQPKLIRIMELSNGYADRAYALGYRQQPPPPEQARKAD